MIELTETHEDGTPKNRNMCVNPHWIMWMHDQETDNEPGTAICLNDYGWVYAKESMREIKLKITLNGRGK